MTVAISVSPIKILYSCIFIKTEKKKGEKGEKATKLVKVSVDASLNMVMCMMLSQRCLSSPIGCL